MTMPVLPAASDVHPGSERHAASGLRACQVIGRLDGGGAQRLAVNLAVALHRAGVESWVVAVRGHHQPDGSNPLPVPAEALQASGGLVPLLRALQRFRALVRERAPHVIHVHGSNCLLVCALALLGMRHPPRLLFTWHDSGTVVGRWGWRAVVTRWALRRCDRLFGSSRDVAERLSRAGGTDGPVHVFRNGVPACAEVRREPHDKHVGEPVVVWCGRLVPPKDPEALIRAAGELKREGHRFRVRILGDAPPHLRFYREALEGLVRRLGLEQVVTFSGWCSDVTRELERAAIAVQTSHTEGLSIALLEQMMAGLAVVATDVGDTSLAVADGTTGLLVPPRDDRALIDALRRVLSDAELRRHLGDNARKLAREQFSLDAMARTAVAHYRECIGI